jgi:hypothetical protein
VADRYWVGGTGTWDATAGTKWALTSGAAGGQAVPTSSDDVYFDGASDSGASFTVTVSGTRNCRNLTISGLDQAMVLAGTSTPILNVYGNLSVPASNFSSTLANLDFEATSSGKTISCPVKVASTVVFRGAAGGWTLTSDSIFGIMNFQRGTFNTGNYALTAATLTENVSSVDPIINLGSSVVTLTGSSTVINFSNNGNLQLNIGTSHIKIQAAYDYAYLYAASTGSYQNFVFYDVTVEGLAASNLFVDSSTWTCRNLTIDVTDISGVTPDHYWPDTLTVTGTLAFVGTSPSKRPMWQSYTANGVNLNVAAVSGLADIDFWHTRVTGAAAPISGTRLGNASGNSGILFDGIKTVYWNKPAGGNWTDSDAWALTPGGATSANNIPTSAYNAVFTDAGLNSGATVTINIWYVHTRDFDCSARTIPMTIAFGTNTIFYAFGNVSLSSSVTWSGSIDARAVFYGDLSANGASTAGIKFWFVGTTKLFSNITCSDIYSTGYLDTNNYSVTAPNIWIHNTASTKLGSSVITLTAGTGTPWQLTSTGTFDAGTSEIIYSDTTTSSRIFAGWGVKYNKFTIAGPTGISTVAITAGGGGINTFAEISYTKTVAGTITFPNVTTNIGKLSVTGSSGNVVTLQRTGASGNFTLNYTGLGVPSCDYMNISNGIATGTTWYAGANSTNGGGNTGWTFTAPPATVVYSVTGANGVKTMYHGETGIVILPQPGKVFAAAANRVTVDKGGIRKNQVVTAEGTSSVTITADLSGLPLDSSTVRVSVHCPRGD